MTAGTGSSLVRFESAVPDRQGRRPGIFAMLKGLRESGRLSEVDAALATEIVQRSYALHDEPDARFFDTEPPAISWFRHVACVDAADREQAAALLGLARDVVSPLGRYGLECRTLRCADPGGVTYTDGVQVIATPRTARGS